MAAHFDEYPTNRASGTHSLIRAVSGIFTRKSQGLHPAIRKTASHFYVDLRNFGDPSLNLPSGISFASALRPASALNDATEQTLKRM